jgi:hypothetical protein
MEQQAVIQLPSGRKRRTRSKPNRLRDYLAARKVVKGEFAKQIGCEPPYLSMLLADDAPWPTREIQLRIAIATNGEVTPNDLAGWPPRT